LVAKAAHFFLRINGRKTEDSSYAHGMYLNLLLSYWLSILVGVRVEANSKIHLNVSPVLLSPRKTTSTTNVWVGSRPCRLCVVRKEFSCGRKRVGFCSVKTHCMIIEKSCSESDKTHIHTYV
jgi:hypothetical protein